MKELVAYVAACHGYSQRKACQLARQHRSTQRKPSRRMLKRDGWQVGRNVVYRLYREEGLVLRTKRPQRRKMVVHREARCQPKRSNEAWTLDFIHDQVSNGQKFRALTVVDVFSREALAIEDF